MEKEYKERIIETVDYLIGVRDNLFAQALNLAMANDLKEIDEVFDEGDTYDFDIKHLDKSADANVQALIDLLKHLHSTASSLANVNAIDEGLLENPF